MRIIGMQTRYLKILIIVVLFFMIIGYAYINAALFVKSGVTLGFNFDEASVYLSNLNVNGINKYSSLSDDKNSFSIDVENGISSIDYYVANNSTQYDEFITLSCDNGTLNGVLLTFDDNNVDKINPQSIIKNSFIITNKGKTQKMTCVLSHIENEIDYEVSSVKKVTFASDGYKNDVVFKYITESTYGNLPELISTDDYSFDGWYNQLGNKIEATTKISSLSDEVLYAKFSMKNYNVNYVYNINSTFVDYDFAETGYFIDWDRSFSIEEEFMITSTNERKFLIGSYTATDTSKALNIEITDLNEFRVWMKNGKTDIKEGYVYPNEKVHLKYVWNATKSMWEASLTGNKTNINISGNLDMSGIDLYSLRIGNQDYRSDFTSEGIAFGSSAITIYGLEVNETYEKKESIRTLPVPNYIGHNFKNWLYDNEKVSSLNISNYKEHNIIFNAEYDFSIDASNLILYYDAFQPGYRKNSKNQVKDLSGNEINGLYTGTLKVVDNYFNYEDSNYRDGIYIESGLKNLWKSNFTIITTIYFTCANNRDIILGNFNANNNMSIEKHPYNSFSNSSRIWWNNGEFGSFSNKEAYECNKINYLYYIFDKDNITFKTGLNKIETMSISSSKFANNYDFLSAYIGRDYRNELVTLGGKLYSFKIYNKVLNQGEIENEYNFEVSRFKK